MPLRIVFPALRQVSLESFDLSQPGDGEATVRVLFSLISTGTESRAYAQAFEDDTHWQRWVQHPF